ncbi:hypothetical protein AB3X55_07840 [Alphaproteobacteria bacterium LSUCC0719]|jgi:hypothetical protein
MFRVLHKAALASMLVVGTLVVADANASGVALVCEGEFRIQRGTVEGIAEDSFAGTMHVALVARDAAVVEVRLQTFEDGARTPVQTFALPVVEEPPEVGEMTVLFPELFVEQPVKASATPVAAGPVTIPGDLTIDTTDREILLRQIVESGPILKARVNGRPLVPTRQKIETVEMRLDRTGSHISLVWRDDSVREHKRPGAIRASKIQLRDEKSYKAECMPVRQRAF